MILVPVTLREANALVYRWHRHHKSARGCRFCIGVEDGDGFHGAAIVSRPINSEYQKIRTMAEVVRLVTDGTPNACSMLYAACWRAWKAMGGTRLITYTLASESGVSLKAAGWTLAGRTTAAVDRVWHEADRGLVLFPEMDVNLGPKLRWEMAA